MSVQQPELGEVTEAVARPNWCDWKSRQFDARSTESLGNAGLSSVVIQKISDGGFVSF